MKFFSAFFLLCISLFISIYTFSITFASTSTNLHLEQTPKIVFVEEMQSFLPQIMDNLNTECNISEMNFDPRLWDNLYQWISSQIKSNDVKRLSLWAQEEMQNYNYIPKAVKTEINLVGCRGKYVVFESTLDDLPSHHPLVVRWLKTYIVTSAPNLLFENYIVVTVRGDRFE
ncbi:MAG: hypothetical protein HQK49_02725 [Oligoflexia bacterium]|nr:hypothetical protein [Oligoflexia bacterium]